MQFRKSQSNSDYIENISFETVYFIYLFDEELRNILRKYIEKIEVYYRTQISYGFSIRKCMDAPHNQHYNEINFYNKIGFNSVMDSFKREKNYYKDSLVVQHHQNKYMSQMPLWVIVELMSFSNISKLYSSMYISEQQAIAAMVGIKPATLSNHLHCLSVLRNKCAHAARLYNTNFNPPARFNAEFLKKNPDIKNNSLFAYILVLMKRLPEQVHREDLKRDLLMLVDKYKLDIDLLRMGFSQDYELVLSNSVK